MLNVRSTQAWKPHPNRTVSLRPHATAVGAETPAVSGAPAPAPQAAAQALLPSASTRPDRLTTVALVFFASVYAFFFPFHLGHYLIPGDAAHSTVRVLYVAIFAVGCVAFRHPLARAFRQVVAHKRRAVLTLIVGSFAALVIELVGGLASSALLNLTGLSEATLQNNSSIGEAVQMFPPIVIVVVLGIVGPIVEEMFFRQFLIGLIKRFAPTWVAVVVSSVLFGALHMHSFALSEVLGVIPHAFFGLSCGLLYVKTDRNLLYPASIHCLNNLSAFLPLLLH